MYRALVYKELRETGWIALVGLAAHLAFVAGYAGYPLLPFAGHSYSASGRTEIPFLDDFTSTFCMVSIALAVALGLRQTVGESVHGTWLVLLHRPAGMGQLLATKLAVGWGLYFLCGLMAILTYAAWASMPGTHPSPFFWWMTADAWAAWGIIGIVYPAAFLAGLRPARWFGTRLLPLAAAVPLAMAPFLVSFLHWELLDIAVFLLVAACLVGLIYFTARTRDFS